MNVLDVGGGIANRASEFYPGSEITTLDLQTGWDVMQKGLPDGPWDIILANHFIEHIPDPDYFLDECKRVMSKDTVLDIGTPNLAAWYNRILFLFGYLPNHSEVSKRFDVGKFPRLRQGLGGHIYVYPLKALLQLLKCHGFNIISVRGEGSLRCWPSLSSAFRIKCTLS